MCIIKLYITQENIVYILYVSRLNILLCIVACLNADCCNCHPDRYDLYMCVNCAGDTRCFLFTVFPTLRVYTTTGYNEHFMYLNHNQQTMPNGLVRLQSYSHTVYVQTHSQGHNPAGISVLPGTQLDVVFF